MKTVHKVSGEERKVKLNLNLPGKKYQSIKTWAYYGRKELALRLLGCGWVKNGGVKCEGIMIGSWCIAPGNMCGLVRVGSPFDDQKNRNLDLCPVVAAPRVGVCTLFPGIQVFIQETLTMTHGDRFLFIYAKNFGDKIPVQLKVRYQPQVVQALCGEQ